MALLLPPLRVSVIVPWVIAAVVAWIYLCKVGKVLPGASKRITSSHNPQPFPWSRLRTPMRYLQNTLVFVLCAVFAVVENFFAFQETSTTQLLSLLSLGGWLLALVYSVNHASSTGPKLPWRALVPLAACILVAPLGGGVGRSIRDAGFRRQIPELTRAIQAYRATGQMPSTSWKGVPIIPFPQGDKDIAVELFWGGGFPVKHTALIYVSADDPGSFFMQRGWAFGYPLEKHWFVMKD